MGCDENRMSINLAAAVFVAVSILKALKTEDLSRKLEVNYVKFQFRGGLLGEWVFPTTNCVIEMEDTVVESGSLGTPAAIEKSPLDFTDENPPPVITESGDIAIVEVIYEASLEKKVTAMGPVVNKRRHKRGNEGT
ncbi:hypothetical protein Tco_0505605 [Tanacetum coccineum]